jgi:hypothetical protein
MLDKQLEFSDSQAVTATALSTNVVDTLPGIRAGLTANLGGIEAAFLVVEVDTTFTAAGAATLNVSLESDSTANLATSPTVHFQSGPLALAALTARGKVAVIPLPSGSYERYLGLRYTVATGPMTAGAVSAYITRDPGTWQAYTAARNPG